MAQILVRDIDPEVLEQLKQRAKRNNRSLSAEVKTIIEQATPRRKTLEERRAAAERLITWSDWAQAQSRGIDQEDSTAIIRKQRGPIGIEARIPTDEDSTAIIRRRRGPLGT